MVYVLGLGVLALLLVAGVLLAVRLRRARPVPLARCGECDALLPGAQLTWWVADDGGAIYLCPQCVAAQAHRVRQPVVVSGQDSTSA